jgi:hypothetical protein
MPATETGLSPPETQSKTSLRAQWWVQACAFAAVSIAAFLLYLRLSRTQAVSSDGASNALQAWDMLHGNLLLKGWTLSDVSFYTTELPEYMGIELVRGLNADVVHVAAAITYTLLVLLAGLLAKGKATGWEGWTRLGIAAGIMLAPQFGNGDFILLLSPDHVGTQVPLLLIWLLVDRAPQRWYVPVTVGLLLAWAQVADRLVVPLGVVPLAAVCLIRTYQGRLQQHEPLAGGPGGPAPRASTVRACDMALAAAAIASVVIADIAVKLIHDSGGYTLKPLNSMNLAPGAALPAHFWQTLEGVLGLFGADFFGQQLGVSAVLALLHLVGLTLAAWAFAVAIRRFVSTSEIIAGVLAAAIAINLTTYLFSTLSDNYWATREIAAVLPYGAVLAGRLLAKRLIDARMVPALGIAALCYAIALGYGAAQPSVPAANADLAGWLEAHHFTVGLSNYGQANSITLDSGGQVQVRAPSVSHGLTMIPYESKASWFDPRLHDANFVVTVGPLNPTGPSLYYEARTRFGPQAQTYYVGRYIIMTWHKNLLADLR